MLQRKKLLTGILSAALTLTLFAGCSSRQTSGIVMESSTEPTAAAKTVVKFFGFKADALNLTAIEDALNKFMAANLDIYISYEGIKGKPYWEAFDLRQKNHTLDDIIMLDHDHILSLTKENRLADLSDISTLDNYIPWAREQFTDKSSGAVYYLPTCIATYNLFINTDLLKKHNLTLPTNMAEFTKACDYFKSLGITPIIANNYASLGTMAIAKGMFPVYQAENVVAEIEKFNTGKADLAEQLRPGLELIASMKEKGWIDPEEVIATAQTSDDLKIFSKGERPFMISGGWASPRLKVDFSYGVYPYPVLDDGSVSVMRIDTCIGISSESENIEDAKKMIEFLTQLDVMWKYCDSQSSYSPLKDGRIPSDPAIVPSVEYLTNGRYVLQSDYNLRCPLESAIYECTLEMMEGMNTEDAMAFLREALNRDGGSGK